MFWKYLLFSGNSKILNNQQQSDFFHKFKKIIFQRKQLESTRRGSKIDGKLDGNLEFKFNIVLDIWEEDGKGSYQTVARDKTHFKLRKDLQRKLVFIIEQPSNYKLKIERFVYTRFYLVFFCLSNCFKHENFKVSCIILEVVLEI